jgi:hypothetical protein
LILTKINSVLGNKPFTSRKKNASRVFTASRKKKERKKRRGSVRRLVVDRESWKRKHERQSRNVWSA